MIAFAAAYSASVTASWNSVAPIVVVVCDISVLEVAPCQCRSLGAIHYCVAGTHPLWSLAFLADEPVARRDLEQLPVLVLMPDRPPVR